MLLLSCGCSSFASADSSADGVEVGFVYLNMSACLLLNVCCFSPEDADLRPLFFLMLLQPYHVVQVRMEAGSSSAGSLRQSLESVKDDKRRCDTVMFDFALHQLIGCLRFISLLHFFTELLNSPKFTLELTQHSPKSSQHRRRASARESELMFLEIFRDCLTIAIFLTQLLFFHARLLASRP